MYRSATFMSCRCCGEEQFYGKAARAAFGRTEWIEPAHLVQAFTTQDVRIFL